jgi:hypothetical protein
MFDMFVSTLQMAQNRQANRVDEQWARDKRTSAFCRRSDKRRTQQRACWIPRQEPPEQKPLREQGEIPRTSPASLCTSARGSLDKAPVPASEPAPRNRKHTQGMIDGRADVRPRRAAW